jgi:hypothetical protein
MELGIESILLLVSWPNKKKNLEWENSKKEKLSQWCHVVTYKKYFLDGYNGNWKIIAMLCHIFRH